MTVFVEQPLALPGSAKYIKIQCKWRLLGFQYQDLLYHLSGQRGIKYLLSTRILPPPIYRFLCFTPAILCSRKFSQKPKQGENSFVLVSLARSQSKEKILTVLLEPPRALSQTDKVPRDSGGSGEVDKGLTVLEMCV